MCCTNQRRAHTANAAIVAMPVAVHGRPAGDGEGERANDSGNAQRQKIEIELAAQQPRDLRDVEFDQQKRRRRHLEVKHRKEQDDEGRESEAVRGHCDHLCFLF